MLEIIETEETYGVISLDEVPEWKEPISVGEIYDKRAMEYLSDSIAGFLSSPVALLNGKILEVKTYKVLDIVEFKNELANREVYLYDVRFLTNFPIYGNTFSANVIGKTLAAEQATPTISTNRGYWSIRYAEVTDEQTLAA